MTFADWFNFSGRVKQDLTLVKTVDGQVITKKVRGSFNWWAFLFTWFYALFSMRYRTQFFLVKALVPFLALMTINMLAEVLVATGLQLVINLLGGIWYGYMFDTWFKNQLIVNGYQVQDESQAT
ncbi:hypothetical protein C5Z26_06575 [Lactobacillus sp. CBA3606]|uniref:hypothetical protein n=1 Tax=Lactobacillus sp. CBA3606 TaxID=2099789 RepID=UPI000CFBF3F5|nr:hypothetical protein [Lactobacillus sp. CBA3606]AVK63790.1 hypothetical protein C5Z26_06575 [Lactobacillus sp. CBA3606]